MVQARLINYRFFRHALLSSFKFKREDELNAMDNNGGWIADAK